MFMYYIYMWMYMYYFLCVWSLAAASRLWNFLIFLSPDGFVYNSFTNCLGTETQKFHQLFRNSREFIVHCLSSSPTIWPCLLTPHTVGMQYLEAFIFPQVSSMCKTLLYISHPPQRPLVFLWALDNVHTTIKACITVAFPTRAHIFNRTLGFIPVVQNCLYVTQGEEACKHIREAWAQAVMM